MFISFEGIDGSGKSTQVELLRARFQRKGLGVDVFREPGGTALSERIRHILLDPEHEIDAFAELLLFSAARAQLVATQIKPALREGRVVICDRFFDSTTAYQGMGRALGDMDWMMDFQTQVTGGLVPDRTYLLRVPVEEAWERREQRSGTDDRMEQAGRAFFERVIKAYEELGAKYSTRIVSLDGTLPADIIHEQIWVDINNQSRGVVGTTVLG